MTFEEDLEKALQLSLQKENEDAELERAIKESLNKTFEEKRIDDEILRLQQDYEYKKSLEEDRRKLEKSDDKVYFSDDETDYSPEYDDFDEENFEINEEFVEEEDLEEDPIKVFKTVEIQNCLEELFGSFSQREMFKFINEPDSIFKEHKDKNLNLKIRIKGKEHPEFSIILSKNEKIQNLLRYVHLHTGFYEKISEVIIAGKRENIDTESNFDSKKITDRTLIVISFE